MRLTMRQRSEWTDPEGAEAVPQSKITPGPLRPHQQPHGESSRLERIPEQAPYSLKGGKRNHFDLLHHTCSLPERLALAGDSHILSRTRENKKPVEYTIIMSSLQRMVLHSLQEDLVNVTAKIHSQGRAEKEDTREATKLLERYCRQHVPHRRYICMVRCFSDP